MAWLSVSEDESTHRELTPEQLRRRRNRSVALGVTIAAFVLIMVAITLVKGPDTLIRPL